MSKLVSIHAREVFDSRGRPTVEVEAQCAGGGWGRAIVPSGASTGRHEALELRDGDTRLGGLGVRKAVKNVRDVLGPAVVGMDAADQRRIDERLVELDGTPNKSRLGANAILGVSLAVAHASAAARNVALVEHLHAIWKAKVGTDCQFLLPLPMVNMISGGRHAGGQMKIQDFLIMPIGAASYRDAFDWIVETYWEVGRELSRRGFEGVLVGDEGGFGPKLPRHEVAFEVIMAAIEKTGRQPGKDIAIAIDVAATQFYRDGRYDLGEGAGPLSSDEMIDVLDKWCGTYPIISIEDALHEDDWEAWARLTARLGGRVQLIGDDLFVTNCDRIGTGIQNKVANGVLIKLNQIGTLSETMDAIQLANSAGYRTVVSARSGETEDATIADLVVATGAGQIKVGSVARSERLAKYNQLLRLEEILGSRAAYAGELFAARK
jgi:enolase